MKKLPILILLLSIMVVNSKLQAQDAAHDSLYQQGRMDAINYYTGEGNGKGLVLWSTLLGSPVIGLIPTLIITHADPSMEKMTFPEHANTQSMDYIDGYILEAKKMRNKQLWNRWGIATGIDVVIISIATIAQD